MSRTNRMPDTFKNSNVHAFYVYYFRNAWLNGGSVFSSTRSIAVGMMIIGYVSNI
jgi:hypothetical protein